MKLTAQLSIGFWSASTVAAGWFDKGNLALFSTVMVSIFLCILITVDKD